MHATLRSYSPGWTNEVLPYQSEAAWRLGQWDTLRENLDKVVNQNRLYRSYLLGMGALTTPRAARSFVIFYAACGF